MLNIYLLSHPEVPVVSLSFSTKINETILHSIEEKTRELIKLNMTGSVQIMECLERPGAIIVRWDEVLCCFIFIYSFIYKFIHSFIRFPFIHLFIHSTWSLRRKTIIGNVFLLKVFNIIMQDEVHIGNKMSMYSLNTFIYTANNTVVD